MEHYCTIPCPAAYTLVSSPFSTYLTPTGSSQPSQVFILRTTSQNQGITSHHSNHGTSDGNHGTSDGNQVTSDGNQGTSNHGNESTSQQQEDNVFSSGLPHTVVFEHGRGEGAGDATPPNRWVLCFYTK